MGGGGRGGVLGVGERVEKVIEFVPYSGIFEKELTTFDLVKILAG